MWRRRAADSHFTIAALYNPVPVLLETGDPQPARERLVESLDLFLELDEPRSVIEALTGLAGTMAATGRYEDTARLPAAMEAQREASGFEPRPCEKAVIRRWQADVRTALDEAGFTAAWQSGRALSQEEAVRLALG